MGKQDDKERQTGTGQKTIKDLRESFYSTLNSYPKLKYAFYAAIVLIVALLYFGLPGGSDEKNSNDDNSTADTVGTAQAYEQDSLEARLTQTLEKIEGVGCVEVLINYESSVELVPAMSVEKQSAGEDNQRESSEPFTLKGNDGDGPLVLQEIEPQIRGVIIVAEGAGDTSVRMQLQSAAQTALAIPASKVEVFSMKKNTAP